ncbi:MAG TPA: PspC domain-containing protein [Bacteroidales bacterium]|nr:PspC domain-containing protein [Bacteroidales bacterium]
MKKVVTIHIANEVFQIEEDAYYTLQQTLNRLRNNSMNEFTRAETAIANSFRRITSNGRKVITSDDVSETLRLEGISFTNYTTTNNYDRLYRNTNDSVLGGVCSGMAKYWNLDPVIPRLLFVLLFFGFGTGLLLYIIMWLIIPKEY